VLDEGGKKKEYDSMRNITYGRPSGRPCGPAFSQLDESALPDVQRGLDQPKLCCAGKSLDPGLFAQRGGSIRDRDHNRELNRSAAARVAAGSAGTVCSQAPPYVGRPTAVERVVGAAKQVYRGQRVSRLPAAGVVPAARARVARAGALHHAAALVAGGAEVAAGELRGHDGRGVGHRIGGGYRGARRGR